MDINQYLAKGKIKQQKFLKLESIQAEEIAEFLYMTKEQKLKWQFGEDTNSLNGKNIALIKKNNFSTTQIAFELGVKKLSGYPVIINQQTELENDQIKLLEKYGIDCFIIETDLAYAIKLNSSTTKPIIDINDTNSPVQALNSLFTIWEHKKIITNLKVCFIGDANIYDRQLLIGLTKLGADVNIVAPSENAPPEHFLSYFEQYSYINHTDDISYGIKNADVIYCTPHNFGNKFTLDNFALSYAKENAIILTHPNIVSGKEITVEVYNNKYNLSFELAENIIHTQKAVLLLMVG